MSRKNELRSDTKNRENVQDNITVQILDLLRAAVALRTVILPKVRMFNKRSLFVVPVITKLEFF